MDIDICGSLPWHDLSRGRCSSQQYDNAGGIGQDDKGEVVDQDTDATTAEIKPASLLQCWLLSWIVCPSEHSAGLRCSKWLCCRM